MRSTRIMRSIRMPDENFSTLASAEGALIKSAERIVTIGKIRIASSPRQSLDDASRSRAQFAKAFHWRTIKKYDYLPSHSLKGSPDVIPDDPRAAFRPGRADACPDVSDGCAACARIPRWACARHRHRAA